MTIFILHIGQNITVYNCHQPIDRFCSLQYHLLSHFKSLGKIYHQNRSVLKTEWSFSVSCPCAIKPQLSVAKRS